MQLVNEPVKDHNGKTVDNDSQDVKNNYKENQNKDPDMIIAVDTENVWKNFKEQKDKENKDIQVNWLTDMIS